MKKPEQRVERLRRQFQSEFSEFYLRHLARQIHHAMCSGNVNDLISYLNETLAKTSLETIQMPLKHEWGIAVAYDAGRLVKMSKSDYRNELRERSLNLREKYGEALLSKIETSLRKRVVAHLALRVD